MSPPSPPRRTIPARKILIASAALGAGGVLPLLLYIMFGPPDGNPIGLGLLAALAVPVAGSGLVVGVIMTLADRMERREE